MLIEKESKLELGDPYSLLPSLSDWAEENPMSNEVRKVQEDILWGRV